LRLTGTKLFLICAPANAHPELLTAIAPFVEKGAWIGALYAQGGFDWAVKHCLGPKFPELGATFGLLNIPWICKITVYGKEARILGPKQKNSAAVFPLLMAKPVTNLLSQMYDMPFSVIPNFLNLTLTPSNQIIHPPRYYAIFKDWDGKRTYSLAELKKRQGLTLYEDFDELSAELLSVLDNELQQIKFGLLQRYPDLDLSHVIPLGERIVQQYGADVTDRSSLRQIFRTNRGYVGCGTPMTEVGQDQMKPNVNSRLFWEDIPYGLCILKNLAELLNIPTPTIDNMIRWHQQFMGKQFLVGNKLSTDPAIINITGTPRKYGIITVADVVATSLAEMPSKL